MYFTLTTTIAVLGAFAADSTGGPTPSTPAAKDVLAVPSTATLQELHDLRASLTKLALQERYHNSRVRLDPASRAKHQAEATRVRAEVAKVHQRIEAILARELGAFVRVASNAAEDCSEERSAERILSARATKRIVKNELLLFHAGDVYRTHAKFEPLRTTGQGYFFRPNRDINAGSRFIVECIQDAPEEIANVKRGYMPHSDHARNPDRAYETRVTIDPRNR